MQKQGFLKIFEILGKIGIYVKFHKRFLKNHKSAMLKNYHEL